MPKKGTKETNKRVVEGENTDAKGDATGSKSETVYSTEYEWRCADCKEAAEGTRSGWGKLIKHAKGHHLQLVDVSSGEIAATSIQEAEAKGLVPKSKAERY